MEANHASLYTVKVLSSKSQGQLTIYTTAHFGDTYSLEGLTDLLIHSYRSFQTVTRFSHLETFLFI